MTSAAPEAAPKTKATTKTAPAKRVILSLGDKGGSSKSFLLRRLAEIHLSAGTPGLMLVDGDPTVGHLFRYYADRDISGKALETQGPTGVQTFGLHGETDTRDEFVNELLYRGADAVVADFPATSLTILRRIGEEYDFAAAVTQAGYRLTVVAPITPYEDTLLDLQDAIALLDPVAYAEFERLFDAGATEAERTTAKGKISTRADYVAVINLGMGEDRGDWELWDAADSFTRQLLEFVGGSVIEFPKLRPRIAAKLAKWRLKFKAGETAETISVTDRSRLAKWNVDSEAALRKASTPLGL